MENHERNQINRGITCNVVVKGHTKIRKNRLRICREYDIVNTLAETLRDSVQRFCLYGSIYLIYILSSDIHKEFPDVYGK